MVRPRVAPGVSGTPGAIRSSVALMTFGSSCKLDCLEGTRALESSCKGSASPVDAIETRGSIPPPSGRPEMVDVHRVTFATKKFAGRRGFEGGKAAVAETAVYDRAGECAEDRAGSSAGGRWLEARWAKCAPNRCITHTWAIAWVRL